MHLTQLSAKQCKANSVGGLAAEQTHFRDVWASTLHLYWCVISLQTESWHACRREQSLNEGCNHRGRIYLKEGNHWDTLESVPLSGFNLCVHSASQSYHKMISSLCQEGDSKCVTEKCVYLCKSMQDEGFCARITRFNLSGGELNEGKVLYL